MNELRGLAGKTAIVTGGADSIGAAVTRALHAHCTIALTLAGTRISTA